jgi:hypothetical protein
MKKWLIGLILATLLITCSLGILAAPLVRDHQFGPPDHRGPQGREIRADAEYIIHRTAVTLDSAQQIANIGHQYFQLGLATAHQQKALEFYRNGLFRDANFHSLRARNIAIRVIRDNLEKLQQDFSPDPMEQRYNQDSPREDELDRRLDRRNMNRDDDIIHLRLNLDLNR